MRCLRRAGSRDAAGNSSDPTVMFSETVSSNGERGLRAGTRKACRPVFVSRLLMILSLAVVSLVAAVPVSAQQEERAPAEVTPAGWTAPVPVSAPEIPYPASLTRAVTGVVSIRMTVRASGTVTGVAVLRANAPAFVTPTVRALRRMRFEPARRDGEAREVEVEFEVEVPPPVSTAYAASVSGRVMELGGRRPVAGAQVAVLKGRRSTSTDRSGRFRLAVPPGEVTMVVSAPGYEIVRFSERVTRAERLEVVYRLEPEAVSPLELRIEAERQRSEVSRVRISRREVRSVAGTLDDAIRVVQTLPGVAQPTELSGALLVRGSDDRDTRIYVDGIEVPFVFHFGALKSIVVSDLVQEVVLYPSNFSVRYGDAIGGILDVRLRDPDRERWRGRVQVGTLLAEGVAEGPVGEDTAVQVAARRSYIGEVLEPLLPEQVGASFNVIPTFTDYQARLVHRIGSWTLRPFVFGSLDSAALLLDRERVLDPRLYQRFSLSNEQHNQALRATYSRGPVTGESLVAFSWQGTRIKIGADEFFEQTGRELILRSDWEVRVLSHLSVAAGVDGSLQSDRLRARLPRPPRPYEFDYDIYTVERIEAEQTQEILRGGVYSELRIGRDEGVHGAAGVRLNLDSLTGVVTADPRGLLFVPVGVAGTLKAGLGVYHQYNQGRAAAPAPVGNPDAGPNRAIHALLGLQRSLPLSIDAKVEGFYKWIDHLIVENPDPFGAPRFGNFGSGRAYGVEVSVRKTLTDHWFGWLSYSYTRSFRRVGQGASEEPFRYDQPHVLNLIASWIPDASWEIGGSFRYASGRPIDSVGEAVYLGDDNRWIPVFVEEGERFPSFVRLDLRVKHTWLFPQWNLSALLELINATNAANPVSVFYNYDYTERTFVNGVPVLPYLAVEATF